MNRFASWIIWSLVTPNVELLGEVVIFDDNEFCNCMGCSPDHLQAAPLKGIIPSKVGESEGNSKFDEKHAANAYFPFGSGIAA